jgi:hypothetical protein
MDLGREKHRRSGMDGCEGGTVSDSLAVSSLVLEVEESDDDLKRRRDRTKREGTVKLGDLWLTGVRSSNSNVLLTKMKTTHRSVGHCSALYNGYSEYSKYFTINKQILRLLLYRLGTILRQHFYNLMTRMPQT